VFHITGFGEAMETIYPAFDLFAMTSRIEGMPLAVLEAMACGIPTVAMSVGGLREAIEVGTTGLTSAAEDVKGLARALLILANDRDRMKKMGDAARRRVEVLFGLPQSVSRLSGIFRSLTGYALLQPGAALLEPAEVRTGEKQTVAKRKG
jgi:glycosyltransferase involved in cell wall biosynthesis